MKRITEQLQKDALHRQELREQSRAVDDLEPLKPHEVSALDPLKINAKMPSKRRHTYLSSIAWHLNQAHQAGSRLERALALHSARARKRELLDDQARIHAQLLERLSKEEQRLQATISSLPAAQHPSVSDFQKMQELKALKSRLELGNRDVKNDSKGTASNTHMPGNAGITHINPQSNFVPSGAMLVSPFSLSGRPDSNPADSRNVPTKLDGASTQTTFTQGHSSQTNVFSGLLAAHVGQLQDSSKQSLINPAEVIANANRMYLNTGRHAVGTHESHSNLINVHQKANTNAGPGNVHAPFGYMSPRPTRQGLQHPPSPHDSTKQSSMGASASSLDLADLAEVTPEQLFEGMKGGSG